MNGSVSVSTDNSTATTAVLFIIPWVDAVYGGVCLLGCFAGTTGNLLSIRYFVSERKKVSSMLYLWMISIDVLTCLSMIHFGVARIYPRFGEEYLGRGVWCNIFGFLYNISSRLSVFIVALQSILRSYSLVSPFKKPRGRYVMMVVSFMTTIQVFQASLPYLYRKTYEFNAHWTLCLWYLDDICPPDSKLYDVLYIFTLILPFLLPALPVLISCAVSIRYIRSNLNIPQTPSRNTSSALWRLCWRPNRERNPGVTPPISQLSSLVESRIKHRATVTILIITGIYITLNIPYWIYLTYYLIMPYDFSLFDLYLGILLNPVCVVLNAAINPVVYYLRISGMKSHVTGTFKNIQFPRSPRIRRRVVEEVGVSRLGGFSGVESSCFENSLVVERRQSVVQFRNTVSCRFR